jgi:hypothetical protein
MRTRHYASVFALAFLILLLLPQVEAARSAEQDDAVAAARNCMNALGHKDYNRLWDLTSDWAKTRMGNNKASYIANWTIQRQAIGTLQTSTVLDVELLPGDPGTGYIGKVYWVTFQNAYSTGNAYEKIAVIPENGTFKMSGNVGAPAP